MRLSGIPGSAIACSLVEDWQAAPRSLLLVAPDSGKAERLYKDCSFFCSVPRSRTVSLPTLGYFPTWDVLPFDALSPSVPVSAARLHCLYLLQHSAPIVVTTAAALMQKLLPQQVLSAMTVRLRLGEQVERDAFLRTLSAGGYHRSATVEEYGQFAVRGSIVDLFPPGSETALRIEFFDDEIESMRFFDVETQRSIKTIDAFDVLPVREILVGEELRRSAGSGAIADTLERIRRRASEVAVPASKLSTIEEAICEGFYWPGLEHLLGVIAPSAETLLSYLPPNATIALVEEDGVYAEADSFEQLLHERAERAQKEGRLFAPIDSAYQTAQILELELQERASIFFNSLQFVSLEELPDEGELRSAVAGEHEDRKSKRFYSNSGLQQQLQLARSSAQPLKPLAEYCQRLLKRRITPVLVAESEQRQRRLAELLEGYDVHSVISPLAWAEFDTRSAPLQTHILMGRVTPGFIDLHKHYALVSEREIFPERKEIQSPATRGRASVERLLSSLADLSEGDFVVHMEYGIGQYHGLVQKRVEGSLGDFIELRYAEGAKLFLPIDALGKLQKYAAADAREPKLTKLGGRVWEKTKGKVQEQVAALAGQLMSTMAKRELSEGVSFGPVNEEDRAFADAFPYSETKDQQRAIEEVLADMNAASPMDRLVCGDVGYGKTEVAMRAAFKAASAGMQVAVVVPTTVLARQHYQSFIERFDGTALSIGSLSRFNSKAENEEVVAGLAKGTIDIVVGTHRLLQRDIHFKTLGLLIIDEEHRFGVAHKERLKRFREQLDVLTLSATPIPRTLHMSLVGIRDLSLIETAPANRQVIRTYLAEYDEGVVRESILRELSRSGQVFFIHNRVQTITAVAAELQELVPEARIGIGHGQMKERELEQVMHRFVSKEIDVLVSTTIVESGLDIPNANTIIIRGAERFGLAELYQLRGRVGRSSRRAYAYLLIDNPAALSRDARKRLEVLQSLDDLGVGFKLALQDMEIRGAGNLLGKDQSGSINAIGYELYSRILKEAVEQLRSDPDAERMPEIDPEIKIGFAIHIPPQYLPDVSQRLLLYQRLVEVSHEDRLPEILEEIHDRFGTPPREVELLFEFMALRAFARRNLIRVLRRSAEYLLLSFDEHRRVEPPQLLRAVREMEGVSLSPAGLLRIAVDWEAIEGPQDLIALISPVLDVC